MKFNRLGGDPNGDTMVWYITDDHGTSTDDHIGANVNIRKNSGTNTDIDECVYLNSIRKIK